MLARTRAYVRRHHLALLALFIALGGTAWALEANSVKSRHIAPEAVRFSDLSGQAFAAGDIAPQGDPIAFGVAGNAIQSSEVSANTLTGADIDERGLGLGAGYSERTSSLALTASRQTVLSRTVTTTVPTQLQATASVHLGPDAVLDGGYSAACEIEVDGLYRSPEYTQQIDELDFGNMAVSFGRTVFAGDHTVALRCRKLSDPGSFVVDAGMIVSAVPVD